MIVMIKTMNVNTDVAADNPGGKKLEGHLLVMLQTKVADAVTICGHVLGH